VPSFTRVSDGTWAARADGLEVEHHPGRDGHDALPRALAIPSRLAVRATLRRAVSAAPDPGPGDPGSAV
jgi:hypothetical protein